MRDRAILIIAVGFGIILPIVMVFVLLIS